MTGFGLVFTIVASILILSLPRTWAILTLITGALYMTMGQELMVGPLHFYSIRILIGMAIIRIVVRGEYRAFVFNKIDYTIFVWVVIAIITRTACYGNTEGLINALGETYTVMGIHCALRSMIRDMDEVKFLVKACVILFIPFAVFMAIEKITMHNLFYVLGGVPEFSQVRDGKLRAQGPFAHPILAGTAGSTILPLFAALWFVPGARIFAVLGVAAALVVSVTSASSGPIFSAAIGLAALSLWPLRRHVRLIRNSFWAMLIGLELVMKSHVWSLLGKAGELMGSTGYHRTELIDSAIAHFNEWWLCGTTYTRHWMATGVFWSSRHTDITSQYISMGVNGGMPLLLTFVIILVNTFSANGKSLRIMRDRDADTADQMVVWGLGSSLLGHAFSFVSVAYFDQVIVLYYLMVAMIASVYSSYDLTPAENIPETLAAAEQ